MCYYQGMKKDHPKYYKDAEIVCACGHKFIVGSTVPTMKTEICSACHPYFTGKEKFIDKAHRIDRFKQRLEKHLKIKEEQKKREEEKQRKQKEADYLIRTRRK